MQERKPPRQERDGSYLLSAADRARIAPSFDQDALEEFLQMTHPEQRASILSTFQRASHLGERAEPRLNSQSAPN
jgi:hypothetical protein